MFFKKKKYFGKNFLFILLLSFLVFTSYVLAKFLPNQLSWKIYNNKGIKELDLNLREKYFSQADQKYIKWNLAIKNNKLDILYKKKRYTILEKKINKILNNECNLKQDNISEWCENIFYLSGLVHYRLGEKKSLKDEKKEKEERFKKAINEFQKVLKINPDNLWAKENIEFILKKDKKNSQKNNNQKKKEGNKKKQEAHNDEKNNKSEKTKNKQNQKENSSKENPNKNQNKKSQGEKKGKDMNQKKESRLPQSIQDALKKKRKELENQQKNNGGFSRSKSKAEQNKAEYRGNPFKDLENDPFFRAFFGNDPFFNQAFNSKRHFSKTLSNTDEKDW